MADGGREQCPLFCFFAQAGMALSGQLIEFGAAVIVRDSPFGCDESGVFQAIQGRIKRPLFDLEHLSGDLLDTQEDAIAMQRAQGRSFQNQQIQRSGKKIGERFHFTPGLSRIMLAFS
jgi:hypothetical protein